MTTPSTITKAERDSITDSAAHLFKARHIHDYWPSEINSQRMTDFVESQLGCPLVEWQYPITLDMWETAFAYLQSQHMLFPRPAEAPEPEDPAVTRERLAQQKVRDDYNRRQRAAQTERDRNMPLSELGKIVGVQNGQLRAQRSVAERTKDDRQSNRLTPQELDARAKARNAVMVQNPRLNRNSLEFSKLVAAEMAK